MLTNPFLHWIDVCYSFLIKVGSNLQSLFLFYMRLTWGHKFLLTGVKKLDNIETTISLFESLHIPWPRFHAYEVGILEAVCGVLVLVGFASRLASLPLIFVMLVAFGTAHAEALKDFQFILNPEILVIQQPYPYLFTMILVFIFGPGKISFDGWIKRWANHQPRY